jgi:hypothetical protein
MIACCPAFGGTPFIVPFAIEQTFGGDASHKQKQQMH